MKKLLCALMMFAGVAGLQAETSEKSSPVSGELFSQVSSDFVARGVYLGRHAVTNKLKLGYDDGSAISYEGGAKFIGLTDSDTGKNEVDAYLEAKTEAAGLDFTLGYLYFQFLNTPAYAHEMFACVGKKWDNGYEVCAHFYQVVDGADNDGYSTLKGTKFFELFGNVLETTAYTAYLPERNEFSHLTAKAIYDHKVACNVFVNMELSHVWELEGLEYFGKPTGDSQQNRFFGGLGLKVLF